MARQNSLNIGSSSTI